jgi:hypothetical protein
MFEKPPEQTTDRDAQGNPIFNPEKAADTPARMVVYRGIRLESRYGFTAEYQTMMRAVDRLSDAACQRIYSLFCDSKASHTYSVGGRPTRGDLLCLEQGFFDAAGGHNGIDAGEAFIDPNWGE